MGFKKLGLCFLVMILFQIHIHPLHANPLQNSSAATTASHQDPKNGEGKEMTRKFEIPKGLVSVDRRGGGGGHGGGGHASHSTGSRGHAGGINSNGGYKHGSTVVPLYVAGAMSHHQNNHQHHGSNEGSHKYAGSGYLVIAAMALTLLKYFS